MGVNSIYWQRFQKRKQNCQFYKRCHNQDKPNILSTQIFIKEQFKINNPLQDKLHRCDCRQLLGSFFFVCSNDKYMSNCKIDCSETLTRPWSQTISITFIIFLPDCLIINFSCKCFECIIGSMHYRVSIKIGSVNCWNCFSFSCVLRGGLNVSCEYIYRVHKIRGITNQQHNESRGKKLKPHMTFMK